MSSSVPPHRPQPTRLHCPWGSPSKNTGVGCHFLLQCMKVKSEGEVTQLCPTLRNPMDCSLPGSSVHGIFQARVLEWGAIALIRTTFTTSHNKQMGFQNYITCSVVLWSISLHTELFFFFNLFFSRRLLEKEIRKYIRKKKRERKEGRSEGKTSSFLEF